MRIAFLSRWNATCGVSLHAELICRKLASMGHEVLVFAPKLKSASKDWHHRKIKVRDEKWVYRVYEETTEIQYPYGGTIDAASFLQADYDVLVVELYGRLPFYEFSKIAEKIKKESKLVGVLHLGYRRDVEPILKTMWDAVVIFDSRYYDDLLKGRDLARLGRIVEISYPYAIMEEVSPKRPELVGDELLFFTYGRQPHLEYIDYIRALRKLGTSYDFKYFVIRSNQKLPVEEPWLIQEVDRPSLSRIYEYLKGADIHLLPKGDTRGVVVSSTAAQCLYSGTPTIVPDTRYFETIPVDEAGMGAVVKYKLGDVDDLVMKIRLLIENEYARRKVSENARRFALKNSDEIAAKMFLDLFESI
ncbi:MAG: glycosyltransferase family 1 protein [Thaumarchaeota archaeon]|nr:glycosyltransferase family 1 protein [Nitrososphaerota archaeon]